MQRSPPPHESPGKAEDSDPRTPMEKFKELARSVVNAPRDKVKEEEERIALENAARKKRGPSNSAAKR